MAKPLLMFTWTDVRDALETLAEASQQRRAGWLVERLKQASSDLSPDELLVEIVSTAILLGAEPPLQGGDGAPPGGLQSLLEG